jgi:tetratricopeptide (TPR) repeat protein
MSTRSKGLFLVVGIVVSSMLLCTQPSFCKSPYNRSKDSVGGAGRGSRSADREPADDIMTERGGPMSGGRSSGPGQPGRVKALIDQGEALAREASTKEQIDRAISMLQEAIQLAEARNIPTASARAYVLLGHICSWRSDYAEALKYSEMAVAKAKRGGSCKALAAATTNIGVVYMSRGQLDEAADTFAEAIRKAESCDGKRIVATALWGWGRVRRFQDRYDEALKLLQKGLGIASDIGYQEREGYIRKEIGGVYASIGQYSKAASYLESALAIGEQISRPRIQQESLDELGRVYFLKGVYRQAANCFQKTTDRARRYGETRTEAQALRSQAEVYALWGRYTDAVACLEKALTLTKATGVARQESWILMDMGMIFSARGQYHKAIDLFEQALEQFRTIGSAKGEATVFNGLGLVYETWGQYDKALAHFEKALEIYKRIGVPTRRSNSHIGNLYLDMGDVEKAEPFIRESGHYGSLGRLCLVKADYPSAKKYYEGLLTSAEENRRANSLFIAYTGLGVVYEAMGDMPKAVEHYRKAVEHTEGIRSSINPAERETFFDVKIEGFHRTAPYEGLARVLMKMKRPIEAFKESEYTRARIFAEAISKRGEYEGFDVPVEVREEDSSLTDQLASLTKNLQNAYENGNREQIASLEPQVKEARENLAAHVDMLREKYPLFAATRYPQPMDLDKTALRDEERVLAYHVTDSGILIYLAKGKNLEKYVFKPVPRKEIDDLVRKFREPLEMTAEDDIKRKLQAFDFSTGKKLFDILLGDVLSSLPKDSTVIIVPDDSLGVMPFEMLPVTDGGKVVADKEIPSVSGAEFFGDRNPISYYQSVTALTLSRTYGKQKSATGKLLVFADPVFQTKDARAKVPEKITPATRIKEHHISLMDVTEGGSTPGADIQRLPLTSMLAQNLAKIYGESSELLIGLEASKDRFLKQVAPGLAGYDKIVFATHGYFGKDLPGIMEPVLILTLVPPGTDGYLRMSEVACLKLNADIVALTACQSGLGKKISGEGTMGMGRSFQYAGALSVLMSMWSVSERSSVKLVEHFFKYVKSGKGKLEALRLARSDIRHEGYDHPFFWAPFILVGEVE